MKVMKTVTTATLMFGLAFVALAEDAPKPRGEKITLKLNLPKGETRKLNNDSDLTMNISQGGQNFDMAMKLGTASKVQCKDVDDKGGQTLVMTYEKVSMSVSLGGQKLLDYDSAKAKPDDLPNPATAALGALVGGELTFKIKPDGSLDKVEGIDELAKKAAEKAGGDEAQVKEQIKGMAKSFDQLTAAYPKTPVDIGDSWTASVDMTTDQNIPMKVDSKYTLVDRKDGVAVIKVEGKVNPEATGGIKGTMTGNMNMDEKTGWIKAGAMDMKLAGSVTDPSGIAVQMKVDGKITLSDK